MATNPLIGFKVERAQIVHVGHDLQRPECSLAERDGTLRSVDARGGVMCIAADGSVTPEDMSRTIPSFHSPVAGLPRVHWNESR